MFHSIPMNVYDILLSRKYSLRTLCTFQRFLLMLIQEFMLKKNGSFSFYFQ